MLEYKILYMMIILGGVFFSGVAEGKWLSILNTLNEIVDGLPIPKDQKKWIKAIGKGSDLDKQRKWANVAAFVVFAVGVFMGMHLDGMWTVLEMVSAFFAAASIRWVIRDGMQNLGTNQPFFYSGAKADVSPVDRLLASENLSHNTLRKLGAVVLFVTLYIII